MKKISIIFPFFNEEKRINNSLKNILLFLKKSYFFSTQIIFVNDGSFDESPDFVRNFINTNKDYNIKIINNKKNFGKGFSIKRGVKYATGDYILTSDIDLSVKLEQLIKWKKYITANNKVYFGSRNIKGSKVEKLISRYVLGRIFSYLIKIIFKITLNDTQCGFKLYKKKIALKIFKKITDNRFMHDVEIVIICRKMNLKIIELPVTWKHKKFGKINFIREFPYIFLSLFKIKFFDKKYE